ncbi:MAG: subtilisin family serine protease, partial [Thalassolituus oleivorans]
GSVAERQAAPSLGKSPYHISTSPMTSLYRHLVLPLAFVGLLLAGCSDSLIGSSDQASQTEVEVGPKLRHAHLLDKALRTGTNQFSAGKRPNELGIIFKIKPYRLMERYALLERYRLFERYRLMERFEYSEAFGGFAVTITDTTGGSDFAGILTAFQADPEIEWLEPDFAVDTPESASLTGHSGQKIPWSVAYIGGDKSSTVSGDGAGSVDVDVYIVDSGVTNDDINIVESIDFRDSLGTGIVDPTDVDGHGTHIAGIIAAMDNADGLVGVAPGARIHNLKVLGDNGSTDVSVVVAAIEYIIKARLANPTTPMVVNLSLGEDIGTPGYTALDESVAYLVGLGATVVVAAGNQGINSSGVTPAHVESVITVGAHDQNGDFAPYSNWGPQVDILAPGTDVVSLSPMLGGFGTPVKMSGTSMAAPHVAGAAALYLSKNPTASPAAVLAALLESSRSGVALTGGATTNKSVFVGTF